MCEKPYARAYVLVFNKPLSCAWQWLRVRVLRFLFASFLVVCVTEVSVRPHINNNNNNNNNNTYDRTNPEKSKLAFAKLFKTTEFASWQITSVYRLCQ